MQRRRRVTLVAVTVLVVAIGVIAYVVTRTGPKIPPLPRAVYCSATSGSDVVRLDVDQMANAATITAVGTRQGVPARGVQIALATALQESKLVNLPDGDRDSVGLFQQRPSQGWGKAVQIADPVYASRKFYAALLKVKNWQKLPLTQAAQAVQRSGAPTAYAKWEGESLTLSRALLGDSGHAVDCYLPDDPSTGKTGTAAISSLTALLRGNFGTHLPTLVAAATNTLTLSVPDAKSGWQYAHWLVAHAEDQGVMAVTFGGQRWTAKTGNWIPVPAQSLALASQAQTQVTAQVYAT